jgi:hypothetical protein
MKPLPSIILKIHPLLAGFASFLSSGMPFFL